MTLTQKQLLEQQINYLNSKPKQFSHEQEQQKFTLEQLLISLRNQWKTIDVNSQEYQSITQKITDTNNQLILLEKSLYNPQIDDKLLADLEEQLRELEEADLIEPTGKQLKKKKQRTHYHWSIPINQQK